MKAVLFTITAAAGSAYAAQSAWAQCGGQNWSGGTACVSGYTCTTYNPYYAQCIPGTSTDGPSTATSVKPMTTTVHTTSVKQTTSTSSAAASTAAASSVSSDSTSTSSGHVKYGGVNIAGFDFGCSTDGTCTLSSTDPPGETGIAQMNHFVKNDGLNAFRLPVAWQYLVNNNLGGTLDSANFAEYNDLVQGCLSAGAEMCIIDIHNYARWNGGIIGQGGPTNAQFASLWSQLATKFKSNSKVTFGLMNEPHDLDMTEWAESVQAAVTAIRKAGATSQKILLPGTGYTSAQDFGTNSGQYLLKVTNLDGSTDNLIFDVHKYLDADNSGTSTECVTNNSAVFVQLAEWLRANKRQAMLTETGGGNTASCETDVCEELAVLNAHSDVLLGWTGWAAGMFDTSYALSETPTESGSTWTDQPLVKKCIAGMFKK